MFKEDGSVIHFTNPKVQASLTANTFAISGQAENKRITDMMPGILNQLRPENLAHLKNLASALAGQNTGDGGNVSELAAAAAAAGVSTDGIIPTEDANDDDDDEVPQLVQNFDEAAKINEN